jgi:hypothetical protein
MKLKEVVPYAISNDIEKGLVQKHGQQAYGPGTFGIEIEFTPAGKEMEDLEGEILRAVSDDVLEDIVSRYGNSRQFDRDYYDWVMAERKRINARAWRGPPDVDEWLDINAEPVEFDGDGNKTDEHREWETNKKDAEWNYDHWARRDINDYKSAFVSSLGANIFAYIDTNDMLDAIRSRYGRLYPQLMDQTKASAQENIKEVVSFLVNNLKQTVGKYPDEKNWEVGMDGDNVEIRSRHLTLQDLPLIDKLFTFLDNQGYDMNPSTSAHIHVGLPEKFDMFSLLSLMTLVDEKEVKSAVGQRNLAEWAKLRDAFEKDLVEKFSELMKKENVNIIRFSEDKMEEFIKKVARKFSGTNIAAFWSHHTVEFRYFGSNISNVKVFLSWIKYFMILPVVAAGRKQVRFDKVYFTKIGDGTVAASPNKHQKIEPLGNKYLDKLKAKRQPPEPIKI